MEPGSPLRIVPPVFRQNTHRAEVLIDLEQQVATWLKTLSFERLCSVFTITDERALGLLQEIFADKEFVKRGFSLSSEQTLYTRQSYRYKKEVKRKGQIESELVKAVLVRFDRGMVRFRKSFIRNFERVIRLLQEFTDGLIFHYEKTSNNPVRDSSQWFRQNRPQSGCEWIVHCMEIKVVQEWEADKKVNSQSTVKGSQAFELVEQETREALTSPKYFNREACTQYLQKKKKELDNDKLAYSVGAILQGCEGKDSEQLAQDVLYDSLFTGEHQLYIEYCCHLRKETDARYQALLLEYIDKAQQQSQVKKKNRHAKNRKKKKQPATQHTQEKQVTEEADPLPAQISQRQEANIEAEETEIQCCSSQALLPEDCSVEQTESIHSAGQMPTEHPSLHKGRLEQTKTKRKIRTANAVMSANLQSFVDEVSRESNDIVQYRRIAFARIEESINITLLANGIEFEHSLHLFGSCALGLSTLTSDIDIVLTANCSKDVEELLLKRLAQYFSRTPWVIQCQLIIHTVVPVLKLVVDVKKEFSDQPRLNIPPQKLKQRPLPNFNIDLSLECKDADNHLGMRSTQFTKQILDQHPNLRSMLILVKMLMKSRNFHLTYLGGVNSYVLFLLLYATYRQLQLQNAVLWKTATEILNYLGGEFDHVTTMIDLSLPKPFVHRKASEIDPDKLSIVNPLGENPPMVNTNCYLFREIQKALLELHGVMLKFRQEEVDSRSTQFKLKDSTMRFKQLLKTFLL